MSSAPEHDEQLSREASGYVEVIDEPFHKEVYADRHFRAYLVTLSPGQATAYHRHSADTLYVVIRGGCMCTRNFKGYKRSPMVFGRSFPFYRQLWLALQSLFGGSVYLPTALTFFMPSKKYSSVHLAAASIHNRLDMVLMGIEMPSGSTRCCQPVHDTFPGRVEYDHDSFKVLVLTLTPNTSSEIMLPGYHLFIVCTRGAFEIQYNHLFQGKGEPYRLATGGHLNISGDSPFSAENRCCEASDLLVLAIPAYNL